MHSNPQKFGGCSELTRRGWWEIWKELWSLDLGVPREHFGIEMM